ncbi:MAG: Ni/Fe-hydrogenase cytochrome b subunit [Deltaproteobacteria bacterium]|nr:Ni/Fe-hydrogenase cytochrome b subunit [Deltaproteobacteria bacterium]
MKKKNTSVSLGTIILNVLAITGIALIFYRFINGIGAVSNLSDDFPWGIWVTIDILVGIALSSGGFILTGSIHIFGKEKFAKLADYAIMTSLLGYLLFMIGLIIDLGRPWNLMHIIFTGNHTSPLYEVGWCVIFYTTVLMLEFLPILFEKYNLDNARKNLRSITPWLIVIMLTVFIFAMTRSLKWMALMAAIALFWEISIGCGIMPRKKQMPIILIIAGVIFSTLHQSSLGSIFLMSPYDMHPLWYSPFLPVLFFLSALMAGCAMVIIEAYASAKLLKHKADENLLYDFSKAIPYIISIYLILLSGSLVYQGVIQEIFKVSYQAISWGIEVVIGAIIPAALFLSPKFTQKKKGMLLACILLIAGVIWNRVNVSIIGIKAYDPVTSYHPSLSEILITLGLISIGLIAFKHLAKILNKQKNIITDKT